MRRLRGNHLATFKAKEALNKQRYAIRLCGNFLQH
jgi:hypothetical protein